MTGSASDPTDRPVPDVSIVVAVYNGADTVAACVRSLLALDYPRARREIIVVNNNSTDRTVEILSTFGDDVTVLHETTQGAAAARNCGIRHARASRIAITDADAEVDAGWLRAMVRPLDDPAVGVVGGRILAHVGANRIARFGEEIHDHARAIADESHPYVISMNWASRTHVLRECGMFDESLLRGQDVDLSWRIHRAGYQLVYAPDGIIRHRNEHTLRGLMAEGYVHGYSRTRLLAKHAAPGRTGARPLRAMPLVRASVKRLTSGDAVGAWLSLVFNAGKLRGERASRSAVRGSA